MALALACMQACWLQVQFQSAGGSVCLKEGLEEGRARLKSTSDSCS